MIQPGYSQNNIINLMSSLLRGLGSNSRYNPLPILPSSTIHAADNVVLFVIDGLGYDSVRRLPKNSFLRKKCTAKLTTVFPSTTAAAITTFMTGVTPREHGLTAWYMYLREFDDIIAVLPWRTRTKEPLPASKSRKLHFPDSIFTKINRESHLVLKRELYQSPYNQFFCHESTACWAYNTFSGLLKSIRGAVTSNEKKKYIYAYWSGFDDFSHEYGKDHAKSRNHLQQISAALEKFAKVIKGTNTLFIITADHGQVVSSRKRTLFVNQHPLLRECLARPLCGEQRTPFCYVKPHQRQQFEQYVKHKLGKFCTLHPSTSLADLFGSEQEHPEHPEFKYRIGDYILQMHGNYGMKQLLPTDKRKSHPGHHGGLSEEEMHVPLIVVKTK